MFNDWRDAHYNIMYNFLQFLNASCDAYILKGGTSLLMCYGLDRFSEDIDLDALPSKNSITSCIEAFCRLNNIQYRIAKDTNMVKRFMLHYGGAKPLKIEVSYRRGTNIPVSDYTKINGVLVYTIQCIALLKIGAYMNRDRIRDLYDVVFIFRNYGSVMPQSTISFLGSCLAQKGLAYFDYIIKTQSDGLIDNDKLASDFLDLYFNLGLA